MTAYEFCGLTVASEIRLPELRRGRGPAQCSIVLSRPDDVDERTVTWFHAWRAQREEAWLSFGRTRAGYLLRVRDLADFAIDREISTVRVRPADRLPAETLRHLLVDQILPLVLAARGRPALHASAVHFDRRGTIALVGMGGRGKSTLAAALAARGARIVTDDCLAIELRSHGANVLPAYPGLRLWPGPATRAVAGSTTSRRVAHYSSKRRIDGGAFAFRSTPSPLRAVLVLSPRSRRGSAASLQRMPARARLLALLRSAYILDVEDRVGLGRLFADLSALAAVVPVLRLRVRHGARHLPAAAAVIEELAGRAAGVLPS
jgi:hypothetical protein